MSFKSKDIENIKYLVQNAHLNISIHHDKAKFFFDEVKLDINNCTFINIDRHSDIHVNISNEPLTPANWVNYILLENGIDSFYWVYPQDLIFNKMKPFPLDIGPLYIKKSSLFSKKTNQKVFIDKNNKEILTQRKISTLKKNCLEFDVNYFYKNTIFNEQNLNILLLDSLYLKDVNNIFLSIDADYFSSNSVHPLYAYFNEKFILNRICSFLKIITEKKIQPKYINLTYSPDYILRSHYKIISDFFNLMKKYSK